MIYFIDSNIFIRTLHKENEAVFLECLSLLKSIKENRIEAYTGTVVLAEVMWTLSSFYKINKAKTAQGLRAILNISNLKITDDYQHFMALELYEKYSVKYIDSLIASNKQILAKKMTVVSYDRDFDKLKIIRKEPREILTSPAN